MSKAKTSSVSGANSYEGISEFWDSHDLADHWDQTTPVLVEVNRDRRTRLIGIESDLIGPIRSAARAKGVSAERLVNDWIREKVA